MTRQHQPPDHALPDRFVAEQYANSFLIIDNAKQMTALAERRVAPIALVIRHYGRRKKGL